MRRGHRHRCRRLRRRRRRPPAGRGRRVRKVRSTEGPCHRRGGQRAARPRRRPGACTGPGHRSPQPRGQSALQLSAPAGTSGRGRHMSTCLHCPMSSRASAHFPTALAGTKLCAEAWEGLRRGLGGTAPRPGRDCGPGILRLHGSRARPLGTDAAVARYLHDEVEPRAARGNGKRAKDARAGAGPRWNLFCRRSCGASPSSSSLPRLRGSERAG